MLKKYRIISNKLTLTSILFVAGVAPTVYRLGESLTKFLSTISVNMSSIYKSNVIFPFNVRLFLFTRTTVLVVYEFIL